MKLNILNILIIATLTSCVGFRANGDTYAIGGKGGRKIVRPDGSSDIQIWNAEKSFGDVRSMVNTATVVNGVVDLLQPLANQAGTALVKGTQDPNVIPVNPNVIPVNPNIVP